MLASFRVRGRKYIIVGLIFRTSVRGHHVGFSWLVKKKPRRVFRRDGIFGVDFLLVTQKRDRGKTWTSSVAGLSRPELAAVEKFLYLAIINSFLMDYVGNVACCFLRQQAKETINGSLQKEFIYERMETNLPSFFLADVY